MPARRTRKFPRAFRAQLEAFESRALLSTFKFGPIVAYPDQLPPAAVLPTLSNQSGFATVQIDRTGSTSALKKTEQVQLATSNGTAQAGVDYSPINQTLTFQAGQTQRTVLIPLLDHASATGQGTVNLSLSTPGGATSAAAQQNATLTLPTESAQGDPTVDGVNPVVKHHKIVKLQVTFDGPVDVASITDPTNYTLQAEAVQNYAGNGTGGMVSVRRTSYEPATQTVTLVPAKALEMGRVYDLTWYWNLNLASIEIGVGHTLRYTTIPPGEMGGQPYSESIGLSGPGTLIADNGILFAVGTKLPKSVLTGTNSPMTVDSEMWTIISSNGVIDHSHIAY